MSLKMQHKKGTHVKDPPCETKLRGFHPLRSLLSKSHDGRWREISSKDTLPPTNRRCLEGTWKINVFFKGPSVRCHGNVGGRVNTYIYIYLLFMSMPMFRRTKAKQLVHMTPK